MLRTLDPLLIASPAPRSGTTLLQRLFCSSPDALIFGETVAHDLNLFISVFENKKMLLEHDAGRHAQQFEAVLAGDVNDWIADLLPDSAWVLETFESAFSACFERFAELARRRGRRRWGAKLPGWPPPMLAQLLDAMPEARLIYIVRDLESTVRSARLIGLCGDADAIRAFGRDWHAHQARVAHACPGERTLRVDYAKLCAEPDVQLPRLAAFAGVAGLDPSVLDHRINDAGRRHETPPELSAEERALVETVARDFATPGSERADD